MPLPSVNLLHLTESKKYRGQNRHLQPPSNIPTKYQLPTPYGFRDISRIRFYRSRLLRQGERSNQALIMTNIHPQPISRPSFNFLRFTVSVLQPRQTFHAAHLPAHQDTTGENNTLTALTGCGVTTIPSC